jgi:hypothetical protein
MGFSYDRFKERGKKIVDKISPKFGLQWQISDQLTLRLAAFEAVKRALIVNQSIENTQVAGFNQFFDDLNGTKTKRYGVGADYIISPESYFGIEASHRDLETPIFDPITQELVSEDYDEDFYRAYLYWSPKSNWAITAEYEREQFRLHSDRAAGRPTKLDTTIIPIGVNYFDPSGAIAKVGFSYVRQEARLSPDNERDNDHFNLMAEIGYRLPNRLGIISLRGTNLLDKKFYYRDNNFRISEKQIARFQPDRAISVSAIINF